MENQISLLIPSCSFCITFSFTHALRYAVNLETTEVSISSTKQLWLNLPISGVTKPKETLLQSIMLIRLSACTLGDRFSSAMPRHWRTLALMGSMCRHQERSIPTRQRQINKEIAEPIVSWQFLSCVCPQIRQSKIRFQARKHQSPEQNRYWHPTSVRTPRIHQTSSQGTADGRALHTALVGKAKPLIWEFFSAFCGTFWWENSAELPEASQSSRDPTNLAIALSTTCQQNTSNQHSSDKDGSPHPSQLLPCWHFSLPAIQPLVYPIQQTSDNV